MMKLNYIKAVGRFTNTETGQTYNVKRGRWMTRGVDLLFYLKNGSRQFITDREFHENHVQIEIK
jgi:hypothetical protein